MKRWLKAFRLRTLPLSLACVGMGSFTAAAYASYKWDVVILTLVTTIFLQILSNLANDYGDFVNGADHDERLGPQRSVQSGEISPNAMRRVIIVFTFLSLASGVTLLALSLALDWTMLIFLILGVGSIAAAIYYTMGSNPYGYVGLGDISVLIFFGFVAVCGTFYLHNGFLDRDILLPAITCGFFSVAVLNVNNIRDIESDKVAGKKSIPVRVGRKKAVFYHAVLICTGILASILFVLLRFESLWQFLFLLSLPLFVIHVKAVVERKQAVLIDPLLKQLALSTLLFVLLFGIGSIVAMT
ncbi:1,4-dihydroxy-2-naphthoate polyprenyltransferase [Portibacter marinus]|uniref:1,4-dihydroxy-2-naphthoate polyprenyltransferase n=1 Tax=Portibacter marinus TaxID=2898660 RepID=UPI001F180A7E|nr:1,4-dihydroxy-2-naphthoate polyprenyltransferase [Portibacter marinus]